MSTIRCGRLRPLTGLVAASTLVMTGLLSGCGVAGTGFHPGVAAQVGDDTITTDHVDEVASDYCAAAATQLETDNQAIPREYFRGGVAAQLALQAVAEQLAETYDVGPGPAYDQKIAQLEQAVATLPEDQQAAVIEVEVSGTYISAVQQAIGQKVLLDQGNDAPTSEESLAMGLTIFASWIAEHDVEIAPQYERTLVGGQVTPVDTSLSVAVGETAKKGAAEAPDPAYAASLPERLRCG